LAEGHDPLRVFDRGADLQPVSNDPFVLHEPLAIARRESRHTRDIESGVGIAEGLAFFQDGQPR
jgi:hypothetical protein